MFRKSFFAVTLAIAVGLGLPAVADVRVEQIVVNQSAPTPEGTNLRVNLLNDGSISENPQLVELQVRENADASWRGIKVWELSESQSRMQPGGRLALDYFPAQAMDSALEGDYYELRAVVSGVSGKLTSFEHQHTVVQNR
jgi:hypothetical protein